MTNFTSYPRQDFYSSELAAAISASDTSIPVATAPSFTLSSGTLYAQIDPDGQGEIVEITAISGTTLTATRGIAKYEGGGSSAVAHSGGTKIIFANNWKLFDDIQTAIASKADIAGQTFTGRIDFSGTTHSGVRLNSLTTAQRTALSASNGDVVYDTDANEAYIYQGGAWSAVSSGSTQPDSSETVAGKTEQGTQAEVLAGTDSGGTGAPVYAVPSLLALAAQNGSYIYAADTGAADAYAIAPTPTVTAYAAGQKFRFIAANANTGASTLDVSSLGTKNILKFHDGALVATDIEAGQLVEVVYDGTQFQLTSPCGNRPVQQSNFGAKGDLIVGAAAGSFTNEAVSSQDGDSLVADSAAGNGIAWAARNRKVDLTLADVSVTNTTDETNLVSFTLPGGLLGTANLVRIEMHISDLDITTGDDLTLRLKYGSTTVLSRQIDPGSAISDKLADFTFELVGAGSTSSQASYFREFIYDDQLDPSSTESTTWINATTGAGGSEDSTGDLTLAVTAQWNDAAVANNITMDRCITTLITS